MAKDNIYDQIIAELIFRAEANTSSFGPAIIMTSDLANDTLVPYNTTITPTISSEVINIPSGYTVKANTHVISYPGSTPVDDVSSVASFSGTQFSVVSGSAGWAYIVNSTVTLEKSGDADIIVTASYTITTTTTVYYKTNTVDNDLTLSNTTTTILDLVNGSELVWSIQPLSIQYLYIILPTGTDVNYFEDQNGNITPTSDFTVSTSGGYDYYVSEWATNFPNSSNQIWFIKFN